MTERSVDELHRQVFEKVAYALALPLALFISSTLTLTRSHEQPAAWCAWIGINAIAVVLRIMIKRSVRRDLAELHERYRSP